MDSIEKRERTKKGIIFAALAWTVVAVGLGASYRYIFAPMIRGKPIASTGIDIAKATVNDKPITAEDWEKLVVVKDIDVEPITFGRGKSELSFQSQRKLDEAIRSLNSFPEYYLVVIGSARSDGDVDATTQLVKDRVNSVVDYLEKSGLSKNRIIAVPSAPSGNTGESQSVTFVVGKRPN